MKELSDQELDLAISDLLDVDRTVPWGVACAVVGHLRSVQPGVVSRVAPPTVRARATGEDGTDVEVAVELPAAKHMEGFEGDRLAAEILYGVGAAPATCWVDRYVGESLAQAYPRVEAEIEDWRLPPAPFSTSWDAAMEIRTWVKAGGPIRGGRFAIALMSRVAVHDRDLVALMQGPAGQDPSMQIHIVTQTGLGMQPRDLGMAALAVAAQEREEAAAARRAAPTRGVRVGRPPRSGGTRSRGTPGNGGPSGRRGGRG